MRYGIIDIGTNSVRFMLADFNGASIFSLHQAKSTTRLGEGLYTPEKRLQMKNMRASVDAIKDYVLYSKAHNADVIRIIATSAVRDSSNADEFARMIDDAVGIKLNILSGDEEALAGFTGALADCADVENTLLVDIGGGSTEVIGISNGKISGTSFECGCVRLKELFANDIERAKAFIESTISVPADKNIVWIGGTASAVAMIYNNLEDYSLERVHGTVIPKSYVDSLLDRVRNMTGDELDSLCNFDKKRGEILVYGLLTISFIVQKADCSALTVSEKGLMDGVIKLGK